MFQDYLFFASDVEMRYTYRMANLTALVRHAQELHGLTNGRACFLGETFLATLLVSSVLTDEERFNLRIRHGNDFLSSAEATLFAEVKGFIECENDAEFTKTVDAMNGFQNELHVRSLRTIPDKHVISEGHTIIESDSIQNAVNDHIVRSFQLMSEIKIQCWVDPISNRPCAYGVIYKELPNIDPEVAHELWTHVDKLPSLQELVSASDDPDVLASKIIPHRTHPVKSLSPKWRCTCSLPAVEGMLLKIPKSELEDMNVKAEPVEVKCHYCGQAYVISPERIRELAAGALMSENEAHNSKVRH